MAINIHDLGIDEEIAKTKGTFVSGWVTRIEKKIRGWLRGKDMSACACLHQTSGELGRMHCSWVTPA